MYRSSYWPALALAEETRDIALYQELWKVAVAESSLTPNYLIALSKSLLKIGFVEAADRVERTIRIERQHNTDTPSLVSNVKAAVMAEGDEGEARGRVQGAVDVLIQHMREKENAIVELKREHAELDLVGLVDALGVHRIA